MPKKIDTQTIEEAKKLKLEGKSNQEIHTLLGVSIGWCKKHLTAESLGTTEKYEKMYSKSKSKQGLSKAEIANEFDLYSLPAHEFSNKMQTAVRRVRANNKENIVRPNWMHPNFANFMTQRIVENSLMLEDRTTEESTELHYLLTQHCDEDMLKLMPSIGQIKSAMVGLTSASVSQYGASTSKLNNWLESLGRTSSILTKRNQQQETQMFASKPYIVDFIEDFDDCAY